MSFDTSKLILGTAQLGVKYGIANHGQNSNLEGAREIIELARFRGISSLDTAFAYAESMTFLGEIGVADFEVHSKVSRLAVPNSNPRIQIRQQVDGMLRTLRVERLTSLLLHDVSDLGSSLADEILEELNHQKNEGKVEKIGASIYSPDELDYFSSKWLPDVIQAPVNILDQRLLYNHEMASLVGSGTELHARSVFLQGLLAINAAERPKIFRSWKRELESADIWASDCNLSTKQAAWAFVQQQPLVTKIIVGIDDSTQLEELLQFDPSAVLVAADKLASNDVMLIDPRNWGP